MATSRDAVRSFCLPGIKGPRQYDELAAGLPDTRQVIVVMDREADFYELFDEQRRSRRVELLVRAKHDRATGEELNLFESVRHGPVQSQLQIPVPRQSARAKKSKQRPHGDLSDAYPSVRHRPSDATLVLFAEELPEQVQLLSDCLSSASSARCCTCTGSFSSVGSVVSCG